MDTGDEVIGPVNFGNLNEFTMLVLAEKIISLVGSGSKITYETLPGDDPKQRQPNIELAHDLFGWLPGIELDEGLEKTISYFDALLSE